MKKIIIVGAGENGYVVKNILTYDPKNQFVGFLDDGKEGGEVVGKTADFPKFQEEDCFFFIAIGTNANRKKVFEKLLEAGAKFVNAIHPSAIVEPEVVLGKNVMVGAQSYINIRSTIGDDTFINNGCTIEHDNVVGAHSHFAPASVTGGGVKIGEGTFVGLNATIRDHKKVGDNVVVGMGAVIVGDVPDGVMVVGNPARVLVKKV